MTKNRLEKPIIILGFGRSGTSIITDILLSHRDLAYISNYNAIAPKITWINLMRLVFDNKIYNIHGQKKQLNKVSLLNKYTFKNAEAYRYLNETTQRNFGKSFLNKDILTDGEIKDIRRKFNQLVKLQFKNRLAFKTTGPSRLRFLHQIFPDAQYVFVKREPLPNISILLKAGFYQNRKTKLHWEGDEVYRTAELNFVEKHKDRPEYIAALQYFKVHQMHNQEVNKLNLHDRIYTIHYEDFVDIPGRIITSTLEFLGLRIDNRIQNFMANNNIVNRNKINHTYFGSETEDQKIENICRYGL